MNRILVVYFVYIEPKVNWKKIISTQLKDIEKSGILIASDLHIIVSNPQKLVEVEEYFSELTNCYQEIHYFNENRFEYWALHHLWKVLNTSENYDYCVYMHTKGMSYATKKRNIYEKILTHYTFNYWQQCIKIFEEEVNINKIGLFPAHQITGKGDEFRGWIWFNFWWARSSYIRHLEEPIITSDRYYYEWWLTKVDGAIDPLKDCCSLYPGKFNTLFEAEEAIKLTKKLTFKMFLEKIKNILIKFNILSDKERNIS